MSIVTICIDTSTLNIDDFPTEIECEVCPLLRICDGHTCPYNEITTALNEDEQ